MKGRTTVKRFVTIAVFTLLLSVLVSPQASVNATVDVCSTCASTCTSDAQSVYDSCELEALRSYSLCVEGGAPSPTGPTAPQKPTVCASYHMRNLATCSAKRTEAYNSCISTFCNYGLSCEIPKAPTSLPGDN